MAARLQRLALWALVTAGLDQLIKALAVHYLAHSAPVEVIPGLANFVLAYNRGAAFSLLGDLPHANLILSVAALIALGAAAWLVLGSPGGNKKVQNCLGLIAGGALGNLIDRLRLGQVIDFVDLHVGSYHWPIFNLADACITIAGIYLALLFIRVNCERGSSLLGRRGVTHNKSCVLSSSY